MILLDTHVLVWALLTPKRLSSTARKALDANVSKLALSAVVGYEIEFKRDRDPLIGAMPRDLVRATSALGFHWWPVTPEHASFAGELPWHHGDPLDRVLIAQALSADVPVVSSDRKFSMYQGLTVVW